MTDSEVADKFRRLVGEHFDARQSQAYLERFARLTSSEDTAWLLRAFATP